MPSDNIPGQGKASIERFDKLGLSSEEVQQFFDKFNTIDKDRSGQISLNEFYQYFQLEVSPFADRVFTILDEDKSGEIDFQEFVTTTWNFCSFDFRNLVIFAFNLYDTDNSGQLEIVEMKELVAEVYGSKWAENVRLQKIIENLDDNSDGLVSQREFRDYNKAYPAILFPAYSMQQQLRRKCFGETFWIKKEDKRRKLSGNSGGRQDSIFEILKGMDKAAAAAQLNTMQGKDSAEGREASSSKSRKKKSSGTSKKKKKKGEKKKKKKRKK